LNHYKWVTKIISGKIKNYFVFKFRAVYLPYLFNKLQISLHLPHLKLRQFQISLEKQQSNIVKSCIIHNHNTTRMTRNWFAVYTKPGRAKKVASILSRKGIKNYLPENNIVGINASNKKACKEPLFCSYVFVFMSECEISLLKDISGIVNFMYWLTKPAIISHEEIEAIKQLTSFYHNIKLEKTFVNMNDSVRIIDEPVISFKEKSASIKFQTLKIVLPSLGYIMIAERDKVNELVLKQDLVQAGSFPKKLTAFFSN